MVSIKNLEKLLRPYNIGGAFSSEFTRYKEYERGEVKARVDDLNIRPWGKMTYREALENAARKLGLIE